MQEKLTKSGLVKKLESYRKGLAPGETKSCLLNLNDIQEMIQYYQASDNLGGKKPIDGFRVYFFREDLDRKYPTSKQTIINVGGKGQMSIIVVPVNNYNDRVDKNGQPGPDKDGLFYASADEMFDSNGECFVLSPGGEHTGLCPNNCGGSS